MGRFSVHFILGKLLTWKGILSNLSNQGLACSCLVIYFVSFLPSLTRLICCVRKGKKSKINPSLTLRTSAETFCSLWLWGNFSPAYTNQEKVVLLVASSIPQWRNCRAYSGNPWSFLAVQHWYPKRLFAWWGVSVKTPLKIAVAAVDPCHVRKV